jgi:gamma-glutamyl phosphate reductase
METIYLSGSEQVKQAGHMIQGASESFRTSIGHLAETLEIHRRWMEEWLERFENAVQAKEPE